MNLQRKVRKKISKIYELKRKLIEQEDSLSSCLVPARMADLIKNIIDLTNRIKKEEVKDDNYIKWKSYIEN